MTRVMVLARDGALVVAVVLAVVVASAADIVVKVVTHMGGDTRRAPTIPGRPARRGDHRLL